MTIGEFELIDQYFTRPTRRAAPGVSDDCALPAPGAGLQPAGSSATLREARGLRPRVAPGALVGSDRANTQAKKLARPAGSSIRK